MSAYDAADFLVKDGGDLKVNKGGGKTLSGYRKTFAQDSPYTSILQRNDMDLDELLKMFDWKDANDEWSYEYKKANHDLDKLARLRRAVAFQVTVWRELTEDLGQCDVSCLRALRTPCVTSRTPMMATREGLGNG